MYPCVRGIVDIPGKRLEEIVVSDGYAGWNQIRKRCGRTTKHNVLACCLEIVVDDRERSRPVPSADRLRVVTPAMNIGNVGVQNIRAGTVQRYSALHFLSWKTVDIATINNEVMRHCFISSLSRLSEPDDVVNDYTRVRG